MEKLPMLKKRTLTERLVIAVDKETRDELNLLKEERGVDVNEWARQVIRREIRNLKNAL